MTKILSVIIPSYNMEKYLNKTLSSLLLEKELLNLLEIIVVNDGSKDKTLQIAQEYSKKYPEIIYVIDKENGNYGSCINAGLKIATGTFIKILDADDCFLTENFQQLIKNLIELENNNNLVDLIITDTQAVDDNNKVISNFTHSLRKNTINTISYSDINALKKLTHHSIIYRTQILKELGYKQMEKVSYTDQEWAILPMFKVHQYIYYPICVYSYLVGRSGQTMETATLIKSAKVRLNIKLHMMNFYQEKMDLYDKINSKIVFELINGITEALYVEYLIKYHDLLNIDELKEFDNILLKDYTMFYNKLNYAYYPFYPFKFIKNFRENKKSLMYYLIIKLFDIKSHLRSQ